MPKPGYKTVTIRQSLLDEMYSFCKEDSGIDMSISDCIEYIFRKLQKLMRQSALDYRTVR